MNAFKFISDFFELVLIAEQIDLNFKGINPAWNAYPNKTKLEYIVLPKFNFENSVEFKNHVEFLLKFEIKDFFILLDLILNCGFLVKSPVTNSLSLHIRAVLNLLAKLIVFVEAVTTKSPPIITLAWPSSTLIELISFEVSAILQWTCTSPPFWAKPAISIIPTYFFSSLAASARIVPIVTTPVPPIPAKTIL